MTRLIIARHGNTFTKEQTPRRVGARTDIPLVVSGEEQAKRIGKYLKAHQMIPDQIFVSPLKRAKQTAALALSEMGVVRSLHIDEIFNEVDYGLDENKEEEAVIQRIGKGAVEAWNERAKVPSGWLVNPEKIIQNWLEFGELCQKEYLEQAVLVVTSNGNARFSPYLTGDFEAFIKKYPIKIATGALCIFDYHPLTKWQVVDWNFIP